MKDGAGEAEDGRKERNREEKNDFRDGESEKVEEQQMFQEVRTREGGQRRLKRTLESLG